MLTPAQVDFVWQNYLDGYCYKDNSKMSQVPIEDVSVVVPMIQEKLRTARNVK